MIPKHIIEEVENRADIVEIISDYVSGLKKAGSNYKALSPFTSEKTPSFVVSPEKQIFKDFSSNKGGGVFKFVQEYLNVSFPEAVEIVADKVGIKIEKGKFDNKNQTELDKMRRALDIASNYYHECLLKSMGEAYNYLVKRGFDLNAMKNFKLGFSPDDWNESYDYMNSQGISDDILEKVGLFKKSKRGTYYDYFKGRIVFPIRDKLGRVVGFGGRVFGENTNGPKYLNSPQTKLYDKSNILYGLHESIDTIRNTETCIIVEGYADVISLHEAGMTNVVAASGTALTPQQLDLLKNSVKKLYMIFDADKAGINAAERSIDIALTKGLEVGIVKLPDGEDPDSIAQNHGKKTMDMHISKAMNFIEFKKWAFKWKYGDLSVNNRSELIRSIISSLKQIKDVFVRGGYLSVAERVLELSKFESDEFYKALNNNQDKTRSLRQVEKKEEVNPKQEKLQLEEAEMLIITSLLDNFSESHKLLENVNISSEDFVTSDGISLFETLMQIPADEDKPLIYIENNDELPDRDKNIIFSLSLIDRAPNQKLVESKFSNKTDYLRAIKDSLLKLKSQNYSNEYQSLLTKLSNGEIELPEINERLVYLTNQIADIEQKLGSEF